MRDQAGVDPAPIATGASKMLVIGYLINQYPKVSHTFIRREIDELERQGAEVHRFAVRAGDESDREEARRTRYLLQGGLGVLLLAALRVALAHPARFFGTLGACLRLGWRADRPLPVHMAYLLQACRLLLWLREAKVAHLHAHFGSNPAEVALLVRRLGGPPFSFTVHGPEEFDKPGPLKLGCKIAEAAFVVAVSSFGRSQLYRTVGHAGWHKIHVVHCALEPGFYACSTPPPPYAPRLVCVGRLCEQKGQLLLLDAARRVVARGHALELVLAGDGELRADIEALVLRYGLQYHVRITGWIGSHDVREELLAARALVLPSFAEGLPVAIMEAMALRRPVLATSVAGIPELVRHGVDGWLLPAGDVEALTTAMEEALVATPERLRHMGEQVRARVLDRHSIGTEAAKLLNHIRGAQVMERT